MKDEFLSIGMKDFISKPIEIRKLRDIMNRWIPKSKRTAPLLIEPKLQTETERKSEMIAKLENNSIDTSYGRTMAGNDFDEWLKLLRLYVKDMENTLAQVKSVPTRETLAKFTSAVHRIKGASANIGAKLLAQEAAKLESAGHAEELIAITEMLPDFNTLMQTTLTAIRQSLLLASVGKASDALIDAVLAQKLIAALRTPDIKLIDTLSTELSRATYTDEMQKTVDSLLESILAMDYDVAIDILERFA